MSSFFHFTLNVFQRLVLVAHLVAFGGLSLSWAEPPIPGSRLMNDPKWAHLKLRSDDDFQKAMAEAAKELIPKLEAAESLTIYSLSSVERADKNVVTEKFFHGYEILGRKKVWKRSDLASWRQDFTVGLSHRALVMCFSPRHGVRIHTRNATVDLLICFDCWSTNVYGLGGEPRARHYTFDHGSRDNLNKLLDARGIRREKSRDELEAATVPAKKQE